jgi:hypothetical protein
MSSIGASSGIVLAASAASIANRSVDPNQVAAVAAVANAQAIQDSLSLTDLASAAESTDRDADGRLPYGESPESRQPALDEDQAKQPLVSTSAIDPNGELGTHIDLVG